MEAYTPTREQREALRRALNESDYKARRNAVRKVAGEVMSKVVPDDSQVGDWLRTSPLVGGGEYQLRMKVEQGVKTLRANLHMTALINVAAKGTEAMWLVRSALLGPSDYAVVSEKSRTGFCFGLHKEMTSVETIKAGLAGAAGEASESESEKEKEDVKEDVK